MRKRPVKLQTEDESKPREVFSFAAFPRTRSKINELVNRRYGSTNNVLRACIQHLYELRENATISSNIDRVYCLKHPMRLR
jgi:hypothetical protein